MSNITRHCLILACALFVAPAARAQGPVVIEELTATWCPACYGAGRALDRIEHENRRDQVILIAYHRSDELEHPFCDSTAAYYNSGYLPTVWFNGRSSLVSGYASSAGQYGIDTMYGKYLWEIECQRAWMAERNWVDLSMTGAIDPTSTSLQITIRTRTAYPRELTAIALITEDDVPVDADNGQTVCNGVLRECLGTETVRLDSAGGKQVLTFTVSFFTCLNA